MVSTSRVNNSFKNIIILVAFQIIGIVISFVIRYFFLQALGEVYLGLNGVLTNILSVLSLADLGIVSAIAFSLYKPLAENNTEQIKSIMHFFKKVYIIIGCIIFAIGLCIIPTLKYLVGDDFSNLNNLYFIYILFLLNTSLTYFYSYKRTLITADQKKYIDAINRYVFLLLTSIAQVLVLVFSGSFIIYLLCQTVGNILENISISRIVNKKYSYLNEKSEKIDPGIKKSIFTNVKALIFHKIGGVFVTGIDSILIAVFVSLAIAGRYSNYILISSGVNTILSQIFVAITAAVGNLGVSSTKEKKIEVFYKILFLNFFITNICIISMLFLYTNFINIWLGSYLLQDIDMVLIVINFLLICLRRPVLLFKDAFGIYKQDIFKPIAEVFVNLGVSILLGYFFGLTGVLLGTIVTYTGVSIWVETRVLYKHGFEREKQFKYYTKLLYFVLTLLISITVVFIICKFIPDNLIWSLFVRLIVCLSVPTIIFLLMHIKSNNLKYFLFLLKKGVLFFKRENIKNVAETTACKTTEQNDIANNEEISEGIIMSKNILIILTSDFPSKLGTSFLEGEITHASRMFDQVYVISEVDDVEDNKVDLPDNIKLISIKCTHSRLRKIFCAFKRFFAGRDVLKLTKEIHALNFKQRLYFSYVLGIYNEYYNKVKKELKKFLIAKDDKITLYSYWLNQHAYAACKIKKDLLTEQNVKVVSRAHGGDLYSDRSKFNFLPGQAYCVANCDKVFSCSLNGTKYLQNLYPKHREKIEVSYLGTNDIVYKKYQKNRKFEIVSCSFVHSIKRVDLIIEALAISANKNNNIKWTHIGDGGDFDAIKMLAKEKLNGKVEYKFLGSKTNDEVLECYANNYYDLFINVSSSEGLPVSMMEAMSFGIPVLATDVGGTCEIVNDSCGILLSKDPTPYEIADGGINKFVECDSDDMKKYRLNSRVNWETNFSSEKNYAKFYLQLRKLSD